MLSGYFKTSDGAYLYYEIYGEGKMTYCFLPGHMCTTKFFKKQAEALSKDARVLLLDSRGFGNSTKPLQGNSIDRHAEDAAEILDFLDLKNVVLLGWSLSGSVAVTYAAKYKGARLKALGLIDACLFPFSPEAWNTYPCRDYNMEAWNAKYSLWVQNPPRYYENFVSRMADVLTEEEIAMMHAEIRKTPPWIGFALHSDWCHTDAAALLKDVTVPVIIFSGASKGHGYAMGRHYQEVLHVYTELHEFARGGHALFIAEADSFNEKLAAFVRKLEKEAK